MKIVRWFWIVVAVAALYTGVVFLNRWRSNRAVEQKVVQQEAEADRKIVDQVGGGSMKVLTFYASPPEVKLGQKGLLCYGVASAASVRIDPGVEGVGPALSRCVQIEPKADTDYTLTAQDAGGRKETKTTRVTVR